MSAAKRNEELGKTTVDVPCPKIAMHKVSLLFIFLLCSLFDFKGCSDPQISSPQTQNCLPNKVISRYKGPGKGPFTTLRVLHIVFFQVMNESKD